MCRRISFALLGLTSALSVMLLSAGSAVAQQPAPVGVFAGFDRTRGTVGDPINLTVTVRYGPDVTVDTDGLDSQFAPFEVLSASPAVDQRSSDGGNERRLRFVITAYQTGNIQLPALTVPYMVNGQRAQAQGEPLSFSVESVIPPGDQASDIRPLKPQLELPLSPAGSLRVVLGLAVAALALVIAVVLARARLGRIAPRGIEEAAVESGPEQEARAELDALAAEGLLQQGYYRDHYARMAECIRRYVTQRYGFPASALTTTELGARMQRGGVGRWRARLVAGLLTECDAVHYAHYVPAPARAEADLQMAYEIVDLTLSQETRSPEEQLEVGS